VRPWFWTRAPLYTEARSDLEKAQWIHAMS